MSEGGEARQGAFFCDRDERPLPEDEAWGWWLGETEGVPTIEDLEKRVRRRMEEKS